MNSTPMKAGKDVSVPTAHGPASGVFPLPDGKSIEIREVWAANLEEEMEKIREIIDKYPYVAMDTEFPGVVAKPLGDYGNNNDMIYQTLKCNVDMLKLIQLGLTFTDKDGNWVEGCTCWQFNFKFSLNADMFAHDSIELLKTSGIDFEKFEKYGIEVNKFGELLTMSGLVLNDDVKWVSFHSSYDFGYLLKTLTCVNLPQDEVAFLDLLHTYFPCLYDVKYMMTAVEGMYGGLNALADTLKVERIGPMHQAGSDSLLTAQTYFSLVKKFMGGNCDDSRFRGELFGLGSNHTRHRAKQYIQSSSMSMSSSSANLSMGNNNNSNNNSNNNNQMPMIPPQMQYYPNVHYPSMHSMSSYGYDDHYQDGY